jgi:hypothetical protein
MAVVQQTTGVGVYSKLDSTLAYYRVVGSWLWFDSIGRAL